MRALLEFLGIVAPRSARREPVALPAWIRRAKALLVAVLALVSTAVFAAIRMVLV